MSKIDEFLKNEKVEWKKLGEVCEIGTGKSNTNEQEENGIYPFYVRSKDIKRSNNYQFDETAIVIPGEGGIGEVFHYVEGKYALHQRAYRIHINNENISTRYLYHYMLQNFENYISKFAVSATVKSIRKPMIENFEVPIPTIETQEKIVKILDKFTNYVTELQAELQARNKQYEYYRDMLLSEEYLNKLTKEFYQIDKIRSFDFIKISELCLRQRGIKITAEQMKNLDKSDSSVKVFAGGNTTANLLPEEVGIENIINKPSVIVKSRGNIDFEYYDRDFTHKNEMWSYSSLDEEKLNIKFLYYILKNNLKYFIDNAISGKLPQISTGVTDNYKVPLPSIYIQNKVVEVLDKFQDLLSDTQGLLPEEIEIRQKQYEYYREKLLTFEDKVITHTHTHTQIISRSYFDILNEVCDILGINIASNYFYKLSECTLNIEKINWNNLTELDYIDLSSIDRESNSIIETTKINKNNAPSRAKQLVREDDIIFGTTRPTLKRFYKVEKCYDGQACSTGFCVLRADKNKVIPKWIYYSIRTSNFFEYIKINEVGTSYPSISDAKVKDYKILVPPMEVQDYVVSILDKFDKLVNDIKEGLPKEIELRQKQYEYYREKLLNFPK